MDRENLLNTLRQNTKENYSLLIPVELLTDTDLKEGFAIIPSNVAIREIDIFVRNRTHKIVANNPLRLVTRTKKIIRFELIKRCLRNNCVMIYFNNILTFKDYINNNNITKTFNIKLGVA